jgi:AraC-like DNA-binding protein
MFQFIYKDIDFAHKVDEVSNPTEEYAKHIHPFNEIVLFITGDVVYTVETESRTLQPGDIIFIPSGKYHFATVNSDAKYERYVLKFPDKFLPAFINAKQETISCFLGTAKRHLDIFLAFDEMRNGYSNEELYTLYMCETIKLLVELYHTPTPIHKEAPPIINKLIQYINDHLDEKISLDSLNKEFNFSKSYISNEFKTYMKSPIMQYIRTKKILAAHKMIQSGVKTGQVAEHFAFSDYSTFYRSYLKIMGFAPTDQATDE